MILVCYAYLTHKPNIKTYRREREREREREGGREGGREREPILYLVNNRWAIIKTLTFNHYNKLQVVIVK